MAGSAVKDVNVYSAVRWSAVAKYGAQAVDFVTSIIVARLVMPEAYGLMGMALVVVGFVNVLQGLGFGPAVIRRKRLSQGFLSTLFFSHLAFALVSLAALAALAPLLSWVYGDQRVTMVVIIFSLVSVVSAAGGIPAALLNRELRFFELAMVDMGASIARSITAVSLAYAGWEVWALVSASLSGSVVQTVGVWWATRWRARLHFRCSHLSEVFGFAASLTGTRVVNYLSRGMADFIVGALLGAHQLGIYSVAARFMFLPREAIADVLMNVFFPVFSRIQDDDALLGRTVARLSAAIALVALPCVFGIVAVGPIFINHVLGAKWSPALPVMYALAPVGAIYAILVPASHVYLVKGRTGLMFAWELVRAAILIASTLIGTNWGILGVAILWTIANVCLAVPNFAIPLRLVKGFSMLSFLSELLPYGACACAMCVCVIALRAALEEMFISPLIVLLVSVATGIVVYSVLVYGLRLPALESIHKLVLGQTRIR